MIANKVFKCIYIVSLKGEACEGLFPNAKELNIAHIKINSNMIDNDIEAFEALKETVNAVKAKTGTIDKELVEFNPEFYPSLNVDNLEFNVNMTVTPTDRGTELVTTSASKVFDQQGDFKNIRMTVDYPNGSISGCVISDPEKYLLTKQDAAVKPTDNFFATSPEKILVH